MGFGQISSWEKFDDAVGRIRAIPGVFKSPEEEEAYLAALDKLIADETDDSKKLQIGNDFATLVQSVTNGGLRAALASFKSLGSILT